MLDRNESQEWFLSSTPNVDSPVLQGVSSSPHNIAASTMACVITELDLTAPDIRLKQSETMDSGIESENRKNFTFDADQLVVEAVLDYILTSVVRECDVESHIPPGNEGRKLSSSLTIKSDEKHHYEDDSAFGSSLHDELIAALEPSPGNNSLINQGWVASKVCQNPSDIIIHLIKIIVCFTRYNILRSIISGPSSLEDSCEGSIVVDGETDSELTIIAKEGGLDSQDFRCPMCRKSIGVSFGKYGCMIYLLPPQFFLFILFILTILITPINSSEYSWLLCIGIIISSPYFIFQEKAIVSMYLFNCRESIAEDFRRRVWPRDYLYNNIHLYSFAVSYLVHLISFYCYILPLF
uniref:Transmembrane protein n=1 Tax=Heterorhabditis bacteriophora TaxID=37862 RepID=A0A1I7X1B1_HETBA